MTEHSGEIRDAVEPVDKPSIAGEFIKMVENHSSCRWEQVGPCVYCADHHARLYQGTLPDDRRTTPKCTEHEWDDGDSMCQSGFYLLCLRCGEQDWMEVNQ